MNRLTIQLDEIKAAYAAESNPTLEVRLERISRIKKMIKVNEEKICKEKEQKEKLRHLFPRAHCKMRSSSSMRKAAHRDGSNVVARSTRADKAATAAAPRASPRQIVHVIDEETSFEAPFASRRSSLLAASGALISTLAVSAFSAGPAEALG